MSKFTDRMTICMDDEMLDDIHKISEITNIQNVSQTMRYLLKLGIMQYKRKEEREKEILEMESEEINRELKSIGR